MNKKELPVFLNTSDKLLLQQKYSNLDEVIDKLNQNYPVQYLIGNVDFYDCDILVNENVLIPRFETELLVEKLINRLKKIKKEDLKLIDLGTGSGCIAIALKKNLEIDITAIDISNQALDVAKSNAIRNKVSINFQIDNITECNLNDYDIIVSNPPYVSKKEPVGEETKYEPQNAIFAPKNGLYFYEEILKNINKLSKKPILIAFEIGMNQGSEIQRLQEELLPEYTFNLEKDYSGKDRFIFLENRAK